MGCGIGRHIIIRGEKDHCQTPINSHIYTMKDVKYEEFEESILKIKEFVKSVEDLRLAIVDDLDQISITTGNCSNRRESMNIKYCIKSLAWKIVTDCKGKFENSQMLYEPDNDVKIKFTGQICSREIIDTSVNLFTYLARVDKLKEKYFELVSLKRNIQLIIESMEKFTVEITELKDKNRWSSNINSTKHSLKVLDELGDRITDVISEGKEGIEFLTDEKNVDELNKLGLKNFKNQIKIPHFIVWHNLNQEDRVDQPTDGYYYINELIVKKKRKITEYKNSLII
jgi:hypothetical protein